MNKSTLIILILLVLVIGGGAYGVLANRAAETETETDTETQTYTNQMPITSGENPQPGGIHDMPVEPAAAAARRDLAAKLYVDEKSIVIMEVAETTWSDSCLGLGGPAESCLMALVNGFKVEMLAKGKTYMYRTDKTGTSVRMEVNSN